MARRRDGASAPEYAEMGDRLRAARLATGLSLRALADRLGVSPSLISQVETGRAKPSVSTLYAIVNALGISLDELLFTDAWSASGAVIRQRRGPVNRVPSAAPSVVPAAPVQRAADRAVIRLASGVTWERLTSASLPDVDFLYVTYEVGGASSPADAFQRHSGREWGYVISGRLGVRIGFEEHLLGPGDAIAFDSSTPHRLFNAGDVPVHGIWFVEGRGAVQRGSATTAGDAGAIPGASPGASPAASETNGSVHSH